MVRGARTPLAHPAARGGGGCCTPSTVVVARARVGRHRGIRAAGATAVDRSWTSFLPVLAQQGAVSFRIALDNPDARAQLVGAWGTWGLFVVSAVFNTFLGEELLFRGLLLPRMSGVFGRVDWLANGVLFALYHLHQPWGMLGSTITGAFCCALPSRRFHSAWFGVIAHSGQSVYLSILMLGLVLGFG
jgi:membrane protease YdiL (CAAX protease family)